MLSWSGKKQLFYGSIFLLFVLLIIGLPTYFIFFNKAPTCFDGKQNQDEGGIDCGGMCNKACIQEVIAEPIIIWARAFPVTSTGSLYNLVAYVQNPNLNYIADPVEYSFRVYDDKNVLIGLREGTMTVPPVKTFPVFEQSFDLGARKPAKVIFKFNNQIIWKKYLADKPELQVTEPVVTRASTTPHIDAKVINSTLNRFENIEVVAIVYGKDENAIATSRTIIPLLQSRSEMPIVFTWPEMWTEEPSKIEIIPKLKFIVQ